MEEKLGLEISERTSDAKNKLHMDDKKLKCLFGKQFTLFSIINITLYSYSYKFKSENTYRCSNEQF
jgi:hypothetical protein